MAIFKCKMCGGTIEFEQGTSVGVCDSCGTKQTLPTANDEVITNLHNRANTLRLKCEFDKAEETYNKILEKNPDDAEAHWGIILCKYGIEYVEDPKTYKRVPTCHRTSFDAILADEDYKLAMANGDGAQRELYEAEAKEIDRIQKDILSIVKNEKPFDVFICYKETDENGKRTQDSVIANDIYYQLTQEGFKVFYAAITLEDKLGQEYEPYIFAALNSAKVMLVVGSKPEYFSAVWVKNEWSRFLKLMKTDRSKLLIPCYRDMDAYELPEEFAHLQAQDMGKIGFINDVVRGIKKIVTNNEILKDNTQNLIVNQESGNTDNLLKRAQLFIDNQEWDEAKEYCKRILDINAENPSANLLMLLASANCNTMEDLAKANETVLHSSAYKNALMFVNDDIKEQLCACAKSIEENACRIKETNVQINNLEVAKNELIKENEEKSERIDYLKSKINPKYKKSIIKNVISQSIWAGFYFMGIIFIFASIFITTQNDYYSRIAGAGIIIGTIILILVRVVLLVKAFFTFSFLQIFGMVLVPFVITVIKLIINIKKISDYNKLYSSITAETNLIFCAQEENAKQINLLTEQILELTSY